jgi:hypothetical protein
MQGLTCSVKKDFCVNASQYCLKSYNYSVPRLANLLSCTALYF